MANSEADPNQGTGEVNQESTVQSDGQDQGRSVDQSQSTVGGEFEVGGEKFTVDTLKNSYAELRKKFTQESQRIAQERKASEWLTTRLREIQTGSPDDWKSLRALLNGQKQAAPKTNPQQADQTRQDDPRIAELDQARRLQDAKLEIYDFRHSHPEATEDQIKELVTWVVEQDAQGRTYDLDGAWIIKNHKSELAKAQESGQKKTEDAVKRGKDAATLGTGATTAQTKPKGKNFFKIKDENEANAYILERLKKAGFKSDD